MLSAGRTRGAWDPTPPRAFEHAFLPPSRPFAQRVRGACGAYETQERALPDDSSNADVGGRYAQALFELADAQGRLPQVEGDLQALERARRDNADLRRLVSSPAYGAEAKAKGLAAVAQAGGADPLTAKFLGLLAHNGRASALPAVAKSFAALAAARRGAVAAEVTSATPLTEAQQAGLRSSLRQALGKDPELSIRVDPAILGGLRVRVGSRLYDASLKGRLDQLKTALKRA